MKTTAVTFKGFPADLHEYMKKRAKKNRRSIVQEYITVLEEARRRDELFEKEIDKSGFPTKY